MKITPAGERALMVDLADTRAVIEHHAGWRHGHPGISDMIPAARTVLVLLTADADAVDVQRWLVATPPKPVTEITSTVDIDVIYDGPDLGEVCDELGVDVVDRHTSTVWTAAFIGFAPGFAYLVGGGLDVARRVDPRVRVPAGSVGLAGEFSGIYPSSTPGGWRLIGRTDATLFDVDRDPPALIRPGTRVRFHAVGA